MNVVSPLTTIAPPVLLDMQTVRAGADALEPALTGTCSPQLRSLDLTCTGAVEHSNTVVEGVAVFPSLGELDLSRCNLDAHSGSVRASMKHLCCAARALD